MPDEGQFVEGESADRIIRTPDTPIIIKGAGAITDSEITAVERAKKRRVECDRGHKCCEKTLGGDVTKMVVKIRGLNSSGGVQDEVTYTFWDYHGYVVEVTFHYS